MLDNTFYITLDQLYGQGKYEDAERYLLAELETASADEKNHGDRATVLNELMGFYRVKGEFAACEHYLKGLLREIRSLHLKDGLTFATFTLNIANAYRAMGRLDEAERNFLRVQDIYLQELPDHDFRLASLYNNLSLVYLVRKENEKALTFMRKALVIVEELPGAESAAAVTNINLASLLLDMERTAEAETCARVAQGILENEPERSAEDYAAVLDTLGRIAMQQGQYERAVALFRHSAGEIRNAFGETATYSALMRRKEEAELKQREQEE